MFACCTETAYPGDASANGRKPEMGIMVGAADGLGGWEKHQPLAKQLNAAMNHAFTASCDYVHSAAFLLMSAAHYHI